MLLQIEQSEIENGITLVQLIGKVALGRESQRIESMVGELTGANRQRVVMDLSKVDYMDSAGVGLIALAGGKLKKVGGKLVVVAVPGRVMDLLEMTQVNRIVQVVGKLDEARGAFE